MTNINKTIERLKEDEKAYREEGDMERAGCVRGMANTLIAILWRGKE